MQPGDLRRFTVNDSGAVGLAGERWSVGDVFVVLALSERRTDFLFGGRLETGWNAVWIEQSSEALDEAG